MTTTVLTKLYLIFSQNAKL